MDKRRIQRDGQFARHAERAGVPGNMAFPLLLAEAEITVAGRNEVRRVLAYEENRRSTVRVFNTHDGRAFARRPGIAVAINLRNRIFHRHSGQAVHLERTLRKLSFLFF